PAGIAWISGFRMERFPAWRVCNFPLHSSTARRSGSLSSRNCNSGKQLKKEQHMKRMTRRMGKIVSHTAIALSTGMLSLGQSALAQGACQQVRATIADVFSGGNSSSGTITQGGLLNGTSLTVFAPGAVFTQDPNVVTFLAERTFTTNQGQLKTNDV